MTSLRYDVVIVGGGLPGLRIAGRLAAEGRRVAVFERRTIASESSALAAGHVPQRAWSLPNTLRRHRGCTACAKIMLHRFARTKLLDATV